MVGRQQVGGDDVADEGVVAARRAITEDGWLLAAEQIGRASCRERV